MACGGLVGIDVGGTFTDAVRADGGRLRVAKVRSTPSDITAGFLAGLDELGAAGGGLAPEYLVHGTTVATNAIVQRRLARTGLVTNRGFGDILEIGTQMRPRVYDLWTPLPAPLVPRERCFEVGGRIAPDGAEVEPLSPEDVALATEGLRAAGVESVAVVLLFSFVDDRHERAVRAALRATLPDIPVALSCEVAPEFREYLRASTTVLNAALLPLVGGYVRSLSRKLRGRGVDATLHLMQSNGGVATAGTAADLPAGLASSGPAAGVIGAARLAERAGERDLLTFDMGGTTADVALVLDGLPQLRFRGEPGGHPVNLPQVDVLSVGAGGGSIASVDAFGSLTVGPDSAGAVPGPACYGMGGERPTVTDAHLVLGVLDAERPLAGRVALDPSLSRDAIARGVAEPLGMSVEQAAEAVLRVADANMAAALRVVSASRGHDPRDLTLVAFGGAGPMHACAIAQELGTVRILVPRHPGVTAALGLLLSDVRHDLRVSRVAPTADALADPSGLDGALASLEREARALLERSGNGETGSVAFELDMRYRGQAYNLTVGIAARPVTADTVAAAERAFVEAHRRAYDYTPSLEETEIVTIRARATAPGARFDWCADAGSRDGARRARRAWIDGGWRECAVLERGSLAPGEAVAGPAILEEEDATVLVRPGWSARAGADAALLIERSDG
ncbi:MAG TPA: hydantoinase/oxoprolinase family protein [Solirubrobacteraceae bacterium]|nr:hydantoinase/oxoprolinase family protein [Solirubrobacteraceae bacterium]